MTICRPRRPASTWFWLVCLVATSGSMRAAGDTYTFEQRVGAQRAIEEVYQSHRLQPGSPAATVSDEILERKVATYLAQSEALATTWHNPLTKSALQRELQRIANHTWFPERLDEIRRALDNDDNLLAETLARASLADRLTRAFVASDQRIQGPDTSSQGLTYDEWWSGAAPRYEAMAMRIIENASPAGRGDTTRTPPLQEKTPGSLTLEDVWSGGGFEAIPEARSRNTALWTGSEMIIWGGQGQFTTNTGSRYDPLTDSWSPMTTAGAPLPRYDHTAVWTGSEMIVWGGQGVGSTGGRYDPVSDSWLPTSIVGAPTYRSMHAAVWTGSEMIVWGGSGLGGYVSTGGRYNPATDTWTSTTEVNAPTGRIEFAYAWTGTEMIVYGGFFKQTGARYNPATDTWTPMSTTFAPKGCDAPGAVWTGTDLVVWGGFGGGFPAPRGRYNPTTDSWRDISESGAPPNRYFHSLIWTGKEVVVWGGIDFSQPPPTYPLNNGGRYDPTTDTWSSMTTMNAPPAFAGHSAVWTGDTMIVWGGSRATGGRYRPDTDSWTPVSSTPRTPGNRTGHSAVWTGSEMIVWGGVDAGASGGRFDPLLDTWLPIATTGAPSARSGHTSVWTGQEMIVWGGEASNFSPLGDGARYDPAVDAWSPVTLSGAPTARREHNAVWTGSRMIAWGGRTATGRTSDGALYDPADDQWEAMSSINAPSPPSHATAVWTGDEMIVWGGSTGGRYDPSADAWTSTALAGAPAGLQHTAVWTGDEMIVWGGYGAGSKGGRYDPIADRWSFTSLAGAPAGRWGHTAVWTGDEMIVWGGAIADFGFSRTFNDGGRYDPSTDQWSVMTLVNAPTPRYSHTALWTGAAMMVWGGEYLSGDVIFLAENPHVPWYGAAEPILPPDEDGDGWGARSGGDCNDADPGVHPGAVDRPGNIKDEDCDGIVMCDPGAAWINHRALVECVTQECALLVSDGLLTVRECRALRASLGWAGTPLPCRASVTCRSTTSP